MIMGGAVSTGVNNDELIDNLWNDDYIKTYSVERVFRAVDRAEYFLPEARGNAYKDLPWKSGNLHLSAPCIYSKVMESLCLKNGLSFLNLGSGTGYLSTMAGLLLGSNGINHGVELHKDVIQFALRKLEDFKKFSGAMDEFDFCEPKFVQGNCLCLSSDCMLYDRVYCGAACPEQYETYMKNLLKINGILVMPMNDQLLQIKRTTETHWEVASLVPVSFASLVFPYKEDQYVQMLEVQPFALQELCRSVIRNILRKNVELERPREKRIPSPTKKAPKRKLIVEHLGILHHIMIPPMRDSDDSSDDERYHVDESNDDHRDNDDGLVNFFLDSMRNRAAVAQYEINRSESTRATQGTVESMETDTTNESGDESEQRSNVNEEVEAIIEHSPNPPQPRPRQSPQEDESIVASLNDVGFLGFLDNMLDDIRCNHPIEPTVTVANQDETETNHQEQPRPDSSSTTSRTADSSRNKREKFDSGLGDEIVESQSTSSENDDKDMKLEAISSSDEDGDDDEDDDDDDEDEAVIKQSKRGSKLKRELGSKMRRVGVKKFFYSPYSSSEDEAKTNSDMRMYKSDYSDHMKRKIQELPLPPILKRYLNFYREF